MNTQANTQAANEDQPQLTEVPAKTVEQKFREVLDFDNNIGNLIATGLIERAIPLNSSKAQAIVRSINLNDLWDTVYAHLQEVHSEEKIAEYVKTIDEVQTTLLQAFSKIGNEVTDTILNLSDNIGNV